MSVRTQQNVAYGLSEALMNVPLLPIVASRAPTTADKAALGTLWVWKAQNLAWVLTSVVNNLATWVSISQGAADFITYEVQTNDGVQTALATFSPALSSSINISGNIIGSKSDYTEGLGGFFNGSFRRGAVGQPQAIGAPVIALVEDSAGNPTVDIVVAGNSVIVAVTGVNPDVWNWKANITTAILP